MKKLLAILLALMMALVAFGCDTAEPVNTDAPPVSTPEPPAETPASADTDTPVEVPAEPVAVTYVPLSLDFKNKTGLTITGLYLYPAGAEDKGNSICPVEWIDKDNDPEETQYELLTYLLRPAADNYDLYVEFADGTNAIWAGLTIADYDKLSLKNGADPTTWEQEPSEDEDVALLNEVRGVGKTSDNAYPNYAILGLEIKNKTGKGITEFYFYEVGGDPEAYLNMIPNLVDEGGNAVSVWGSGKGGLYVFDFFIRPVADTYEIMVVYEDGETMTVTGIDLFKPNGDGFTSNEISMKDAVDPDLTEVSYDDGDPEPLQYIKDSIAEGLPADLWYPTY